MRIAARNEALQTATEQLQLKIQQKVVSLLQIYRKKGIVQSTLNRPSQDISFIFAVDADYSNYMPSLQP